MRRLHRSLAALAVLFGITAVVAASDFQPRPYDITELKPGIYALTWREPLANPVEANVLIVINDEDVLVVDSSFLPSTSRRIVQEIKKLTPKPVRRVVNTHWHNDHVQGNEVYRETWPGVEFIAHANTRRDAIEQAFGQVEKSRAQVAESIPMYEKWLADGKDNQGKPIDAARRGRIEAAIEAFRVIVAETAKLRPAPPDVIFEDSLVLHCGSRVVEIRHLGRGNTRGDVVVFLPAERIVATGDLVVHPEPFAFGSYYKEWIATLGKLSALDADVFFTGHGAIQRDRAYIDKLRALLGSLTEQVDAAVARGASLEDTKKAVTLEDWKKRFAGEDETIARAFDAFFVAPAVERAWRQAKGEAESLK
jgi:glyoxylase-like metal-dependent hydrolase (beta-lactamase superfamily II)